MSEPGPQQNQQDAPDTTGGVSRTSEPELRRVERPAAPRAVETKREDARKNIAYGLLIVLIGQLIFFAGTVFGSAEAWERSQEFMHVTLAGTLGLLGSAVGFYFGSQR